MRIAAFFFLFFCLCPDLYAGPIGGSLSPDEMRDFLNGLDYDYVQGNMTLSQSATFYGYATQLFLKSNGGQTNWFTNVSDTTGTLNSGDSFGSRFEKVVSSPTIMTATLESGATLQYFIGGLKQK